MTITWIGSPNKDGNRKPIDRIVIHWIVGNLAAADAVFKKPNSTSAHYAIEDEIIHQYVNENEVAYQAGPYAMNQRSIGIEHSAEPDRTASDATYRTSAALIKEIASRYNIPLDREHIIGHREVKATQCPGTMDIDRLIREAQATGDTQKIIDELRVARDNNWNLYQGEIEEGKKKDERILELEGQVTELTDECNQFKNANKTLNDKLSDMAEAIKKDAVEDVDTLTKLIEREHDINEFKKAAGLPITISTKKALESITGLRKPHDEVVKEHQKLGKALEQFFYKRAPQTKGIVKSIVDTFVKIWRR